MAILRVGILSDTHGVLWPEVARALEGCDVILHAGDILKESILDELGLMGKVYAVRGNCDYLPWSWDLKGQQRFSLDGVRFFMTHRPDDVPSFPDADVVVTGHTHRYAEEWKDNCLYINPGSCSQPRVGKYLTLAILTLMDGELLVQKQEIYKS